ncbi:MAG: HipA N-terminal domain-containing protein [Promicromonosporaceae bacterium]|nr:HipA N-terminal domain-containing protein [Promicromonosporaceae bacterium]
MSKWLSVLLYNEHVADLEQTAGGQHRLHYLDSTNRRTPVSLSMPYQGKMYLHRQVEPFLLGLLPDREETKRAIGAESGVFWRNPFALLSHIGLDCAGAIQFCDPDDVDETLARSGQLKPVDDSWIGRRLAELRVNPAA